MTSAGQKRRLLIVGGMFVVAVFALWGRLVQVQYFRHDEYLQRAQEQREASVEVAATRGGIFDREGRPLAMNIRRCSVAVQPAQVKDPRTVVRALARALGISEGTVRQRLRSRKSYVYVKHNCMLDEQQRLEFRKLAGVAVELKANRIYPYDAVGSKLVGFVSRENRGLSGVEAAYNDALRGTPGHETVIRNGAYKSDRYYRFIDRKPRDGKHVYLTIDATVQDIAETELRRAVEENGAKGGAVIVMEVATGDILALAEAPSIGSRASASRADSLWTLSSVSHIYEPGSTFKLVTAAALLEKSTVALADSFDAEKGEADLGFAKIRDTHPHEWLTIQEAFELSSNIVMAKAAMSLSAGDFYGYAKLFGFGARTGIGLPGESAGSVPPIDRWSARTKSTMAFGQEVAVTPLQMLNAFAAVANGGVMMMPRLVKAVVDPATGDVARSEPVVVRRVVTAETAAKLREFCAGVVERGTGTAAAVEFMRVAGKTGTAQKAGRRGYVPNKYISSFIGFAPYENPRIACLVMLDEPNWSSRFGGESAAPVFAHVCRSLASATPIFDDILAVETLAVSDPSGRRRPAPNFLRMERTAALSLARRTGNNVLVQGEDGRVVAQVPAPGAAIERNAVIRLFVAPGDAERLRVGMESNARARAGYRAAALTTARDDRRDTIGAVAKTVAIAGQTAVTTALVGR
ncbi:MAG TPA: penicillin-binding transpeptidase domain-containing protein [Candidatus Krumholzibacteria bacterium]|nr:penicillin-binding transpeptidase domain-containing protein [Candidatus Krumholzibacteria bacterium]